MPRLLIKLAHQQNQLFELHGAKLSIGRGENADLSLPHSSVSRTHAHIENTGNSYEIRDNGSGNGIYVNGKQTEGAVLKSKDELRIGVYTLIFLGDTQDDKFYRGRAVVYLPAYNPKDMKEAAAENSTEKFSVRDAQKLMQESDLMNNGCIIDTSGNTFYPESNPITFGDDRAMLEVEGLFIGEKVAIIYWNGDRHCIESKSWRTAVRVNGTKTKLQPLRSGDEIKIGSSVFQSRVKK